MTRRILFLAPQPFFQERGTPIAVRLALEALTQNTSEADVSVVLVTYPDGEEVVIPGVTIDRVRTPAFLHGVGPGISWKKLCTDVLMIFKVLRILWKNRKDQFVMVHAIEESVFIAAVAKFAFKIPYIYDMDSSLSLQLTEQWKWLRPIRPLFENFEKFVIRNAVAVAPVCDSLKEIANRHGSRSTVMLRDVSLLSSDPAEPSPTAVRREMRVPDDGIVITYVGNLESYQGVDLLIKSFAILAATCPRARLAIIGGREEHQKELCKLASKLGVDSLVTFLGPRPVKFLRAYLRASDILAAPRTKGNNTPMKIYSYLHSGRPMVATRLATHTQVLDDSIAVLADAEPNSFSEGLRALVESEALRSKIGSKAEQCAELNFTPQAFRQQLLLLYREAFGQDSSIVTNSDDTIRNAPRVINGEASEERL